MLSCSRDIPRELRITRELPGFAPGCKYSTSTRMHFEELTKNQDRPSLQLIFTDLKKHVMVEAKRDLDEALGKARQNLTRYVLRIRVWASVSYFQTEVCRIEGKRGGIDWLRRDTLKRESARQDQMTPAPYKQMNREHRRLHRRNDSWQTTKATSTRKSDKFPSL